MVTPADPPMPSSDVPTLPLLHAPDSPPSSAHPHAGYCAAGHPPLTYTALPACPVCTARLERDAAYTERNALVSALARLAPALGWTAGLARPEIPGWDPAWLNVCYLDTPAGQLSWHYHDREAHLFAGLPAYTGAWDGHSTPEKYDRLTRASDSGADSGTTEAP